MKIIGFDPGGTTGMTIYEDDEWSFEQLSGNHHGELYRQLTVYNPDLIICESYDKRSNLAANPIALEYIGIIKTYCDSTGVPLVFQNSSVAKAFWTNSKLKTCGVYSTGLKHANDATRHILSYLLRTNQLPDLYLDLLKSEILS